MRFYQEVLEFPLTEIFENRDYQGSNHFFFDIGNGNLLAFFDFPGLDLGPYAEVLGGLHHIAISVEPEQLGAAEGQPRRGRRRVPERERDLDLLPGPRRRPAGADRRPARRDVRHQGAVTKTWGRSRRRRREQIHGTCTETRTRRPVRRRRTGGGGRAARHGRRRGWLPRGSRSDRVRPGQPAWPGVRPQRARCTSPRPASAAPGPASPGPEGPACFGHSGAVTKITKHGQRRVVTGLASFGGEGTGDVRDRPVRRGVRGQEDVRHRGARPRPGVQQHACPSSPTWASCSRSQEEAQGTA